MMRRTNIYLNDDQMVFLKMMAAQERCTVAELVRQAVDTWLADKLPQQGHWGAQLDEVVARLRAQLPASTSDTEVEDDVAAAMSDVKAERARRR